MEEAALLAKVDKTQRLIARAQQRLKQADEAQSRDRSSWVQENLQSASRRDALGMTVHYYLDYQLLMRVQPRALAAKQFVEGAPDASNGSESGWVPALWGYDMCQTVHDSVGTQVWTRWAVSHL